MSLSLPLLAQMPPAVRLLLWAPPTSVACVCVSRLQPFLSFGVCSSFLPLYFFNFVVYASLLQDSVRVDFSLPAATSYYWTFQPKPGCNKYYVETLYRLSIRISRRVIMEHSPSTERPAFLVPKFSPETVKTVTNHFGVRCLQPERKHVGLLHAA